MAKAVFRPGEAKNIEEKVMLPLYKDYSPIEEAVVEEEEEYTGPTAEDLRRPASCGRGRMRQASQSPVPCEKILPFVPFTLPNRHLFC